MRRLSCLLSLLFVCTFFGRPENAAPLRADETKPEKPTAKPVPVNMHDFMEGVFQSPYRRLKAAMAAEPKDNKEWKALRSDALILAEGGNLLLMRLPEKNVDHWTKYSVDSRDAGADLIKAAKAKNFAGAKKSYQAMLVHCNACHKEFADGKHMLTP